MVRLSDEYIEYILPEDLENLKWNESLYLSVEGDFYPYLIRSKDKLCIGEDDMQFLHNGRVVDVDYEDIECMYKVKEPFYSDRIDLIVLGYFLVVLGCVFVALGV